VRILVAGITGQLGHGLVAVAGETNWAAPARRLTAVNVLGALGGAQVAKELASDGDAPLYCYASSIHAAGAVLGHVPELPFPANGERTAYEQAKWLAERRLLDAARDGTPTAIARIGGLVGSSRSGATAKRNSLYMLADRLDELPGGLLPVVRAGRVDMLPRDEAADLLLAMLARLHAEPPAEPVIAHVCAGEAAPTTDALIAALRYRAHGRAGRPRTVRVPARALVWSSANLHRLRAFGVADQNLLVGLRYLSLDRVFERTRLASLVERTLPEPSADQLVRLAFEVPSSQPQPSRGDPVLARFAG